jgi:Kef-type K+ transport system membrane component KefB
MPDTAPVLATLGALLLLGLVGDLLARKLPLPRVTLLVIFGIACGPSGFAVLPVDAETMYPLISNIALLMVGFLLGGKLSRETLRATGRHVLAISAFEVLGTTLCVLGGLLLMGVDPVVAMLLAGIAPASAPAAVQNVTEELRSKGPFTDTLLGIVAIDDAWGLIVFSILLAAAQVVSGNGGGVDALLHGVRDLGGALVIGGAVGVPAAYLTGRLRPGEPMQAEALGVVLFAGGLALWLEVSFLLTAMIVGAIIVNLAAHHERPFQEIEGVEWPFMVLFFVLAGASLHVDKLSAIGLVGAAYIALRAVGLLLGAYLGGGLSGAPTRLRRWMGVAILPQAGVALGMALVAGNAFPALRDTVLPLVIASTVVFELAGPALTRTALIRAGERRDGDHRQQQA